MTILVTYFSQQLRLYRELSKSGIVALVLISVFAGYLLGQSPEIPLQWSRLFSTLIGLLLLASGSSALNQLQERKMDAQMKRTESRPLPSGRLSLPAAITFVLATIFFGLLILKSLDTSLFYLGIGAVVSYNGLYTIWWKRRWAYAAVPGAIPGALPILMGYSAASGKVFHPSGLYLFFILFFWQMPHFWTLALKYQKDYQQGGFPTLPVRHGMRITLFQIVIWCLSYLGLAIIGPLFLKVQWIYLIPTLLMSAKVVYELYLFVQSPESKKWLHFFLWVA